MLSVISSVSRCAGRWWRSQDLRDRQRQRLVQQRARGQVDRDADVQAVRPATRAQAATAWSSTRSVSGTISPLRSASGRNTPGRERAPRRVVPPHAGPRRRPARPASRSITGSTSIADLAVGDAPRAARPSATAARGRSRRCPAGRPRRVSGPFLAAYIAMSARLSRSPTVVAWSGARAMPDRAGQVQPVLVDDQAARAARRSAGRRRPCRRPRPARPSTANSSPPSRATVTPGPAAALSRRATSRDEHVAHVVAEGVVDGLEAVEVDDHHRDAALPRRRARDSAGGQRHEVRRGWAAR